MPASRIARIAPHEFETPSSPHGVPEFLPDTERPRPFPSPDRRSRDTTASRALPLLHLRSSESVADNGVRRLSQACVRGLEDWLWVFAGKTVRLGVCSPSGPLPKPAANAHSQPSKFRSLVPDERSVLSCSLRPHITLTAVGPVENHLLARESTR